VKKKTCDDVIAECYLSKVDLRHWRKFILRKSYWRSSGIPLFQL